MLSHRVECTLHWYNTFGFEVWNSWRVRASLILNSLIWYMKKARFWLMFYPSNISSCLSFKRSCTYLPIFETSFMYYMIVVCSLLTILEVRMPFNTMFRYISFKVPHAIFACTTYTRFCIVYNVKTTWA